MSYKKKSKAAANLSPEEKLRAARFKEEWAAFMKKHNFSSAGEAIDNTKEISTYARETISRYCNGTRPIQPDGYETFSALFKVRREYLEGKDDYRTDDDVLFAYMKNVCIADSIRDIMINLGYADLEMGEADFKNPTFPPNTVHFLRSIKEEYAKMDEPIDVNVIVDVNKDKFISIKNNVYDAFLNDVTDYISFKMSQLFDKCAQEVPLAILNDGSEFFMAARHSNTILHLKDGRTMAFTSKYVPASQLASASPEDLWDISVH